MSLMPDNYVYDGDEHAQAHDQDGATTVKSGGSGINFQSQVHLSAESSASTISEQQDDRSRDYLGERTYDYFQARSAWIRQTKEECDGHDSEEAALKVGLSLIRCPHEYRTCIKGGYVSDGVDQAPAQILLEGYECFLLDLGERQA